MRVDYDEVVRSVWPDGHSSFEVLGGGITNHNLKVSRADGTFVLRIAGKETELLGIDRSVELEATRAAAAVGVGPDVVDFVEPEGWLVTRFLEGEIPLLERMREPATLRRVAATLRAIHSGPPVRGRFNAFRIVEDYRTTAFERGAEVPPGYVTGPPARTSDRASPPGRAGASVPQRSPQCELHRRRPPTADRRLGVRRDG